MQRSPQRIDIKREDLERLLEHARPSLTEAEYQQLKAALDTLVYLAQLVGNKNTTIARLRQILFGASTEKTATVLKSLIGPTPEATPPTPAADTAEPSGTLSAPPREGHGRHGANDYSGAITIPVPHPNLSSGVLCPECRRGKLYEVTPAGTLVRVTGQAPLAATVYQLHKLRCNLCLDVFTAAPPDGIGTQKYDAGAASMIALLKYGSGVPFYRLAGLQNSLGVPLPASTQWEIVEKTATLMAPAFDELVREAAQGEVVHNDDTSMTILAHAPDSASAPAEAAAAERRGVFTSGIVSTREGRSIALFFTGQKHAGENLAHVLAQRAAELAPPIQMADALSRNFVGPLKTIVANCLAHGRRKVVDVAAQFPDECRYILETLAVVYQNDAQCKEQRLSPAARLNFHQTHSDPLMKTLETWLSAQFEQRLVEPNSGLGQAITYLRRHWTPLTLFLRRAGAPLDNNVCEQVLKRAILHRKNALFYKTDHGAQVGDTFMSLIHTCALVAANPFDYLTALQTHSTALSQNPAQWLPWNYRDTLAQLDSS